VSHRQLGAEIADRSDAIRATVRQSFQHWVEMIAATIGEAQRAGTVSAEIDAETTARFLLNAWEGSLIMARADRSPAAFDSFFAIAFGTLLVP
jgi:TetR/AcrR family transcriptional repressor of nem operon